MMRGRGSTRGETRFEDIVSDDDGEESDGELPFEFQGVSSGSSKQARRSSARKEAPRRVSHRGRTRQASGGLDGEDDVLSSRAAAGPSSLQRAPTKAVVPGARGAPPPSAAHPHHHHTVRERITEAETPVIVRNRERRAEIDDDGDDGDGRRVSSGAVKTARRTSLLKDGTPAYPHPQLPDAELYRHCSGEMQPQERMKHVAGWTLERSRNELKRSSGGLSARYRAPLMAALKTTLHDLNRGTLHIDWQQRQHDKDREAGKRKKTATAAQSLPPHPRNEANRNAALRLEKTVQNMEREERAWREAEEQLQAFQDETVRLQTDSAHVDESTSLEDMLAEGAAGGGGRWTAEDRKRLQIASQALTSPFSHRPGTEDDARWRDVEFKADLLRSKAHAFAQLSSLSQRYISAVSARGARALEEMTQGTAEEGQRRRPDASSSSTVSRESRDNLEQILATIRTIEDDADQAGESDRAAAGDTSDGDILRAYVELS